MLQRELWVKLIHDANFERGFAVVRLSFIFNSPLEDEKKEEKQTLTMCSAGKTSPEYKPRIADIPGYASIRVCCSYDKRG